MSRWVILMPLAIGALGQAQDEQVSLLQTRAKMMEEEDRVWSNVTRDEATNKMVEDELTVANVSGLDAERFLVEYNARRRHRRFRL